MGLLEGANRRLGRDSVETGIAGRLKARRTKAAMKIPDSIARAPRSQWEGVSRNSCSSWRSWPLPFAPTILFASTPLLNTRRVGMLMTS